MLPVAMVDLVGEIVIVRNITYMVYFWSGGCLLLFLFILWRMKLFKRALAAVGVSFVVNIGWEISLWLTGSRVYDSALPVWLEFTYHGFTELAPFVLFWMICLKLFGFIGEKKKGKQGEKTASKSISGEEEMVGPSGAGSGRPGASEDAPKAQLINAGEDPPSQNEELVEKKADLEGNSGNKDRKKRGLTRK